MISLVSIVLPVYNAERYVARSIASALGQSRRELELLVVDDGSTDRSRDVARQFCSDPRVRLIASPNGGPSRARNHGIRQGRGDFLAFLDADDVWLPDKLERQLAVFEKMPDLGVVYCQRETIDEEGRVIDGYRPRLFSGSILEQLWVENPICLSSAVVKRGVFNGVGLFDETLRMSEDYEFWLRVATEFRFRALPEILVQYRVHPSQTSNRTEDRLRAVAEIRQRFERDHGPRLTSGTRRRAQAYQLFTRAYRAEKEGERWRSLQDYLKSLRLDPRNIQAMKGVVKAVLPLRRGGGFRRGSVRDGAADRVER